MNKMYLLLLLQVPCILATEEDLQLVHVFFRHGARTPEQKDQFPTDPYQIEEFQPMGFGQLTMHGKRKSYRLGKNLRRRYDKFLGNVYTPDVVKAVSTDYDRTKMSLLSALAGLFPPSEHQPFYELGWSPVPYEYDKAENDFILRRPTLYCPTYLNHFNELLDRPYARQIVEDHGDIFKYVAEHSGKSVTTLGEMFGIYQTLTAERFMNLTLPEWTKSVYPEQIHDIVSKLVDLENFDHVLKRLNGGRSLSRVIENMLMKASGRLDPEGRKIFMYCGHENNVINVLAALDVFEPHVPEYSASVLIELYYLPSEEQHAVKVFYVRDAHSDPELMILRNCTEFCPLQNFIEITEAHIPLNYTRECNSAQYLD